MKLAIVSHKLCWNSPAAPELFQTDGGFPLQIRAISELFNETRVVVPCCLTNENNGLLPLEGRNLSVAPLDLPKGKDWRRKLNMPFWFLKNSRKIWHEVSHADAVHAPIPGDIGTIGMLFALLQRKPLFVRHCGNWFIQKTAAEHFWRWAMESFAGGRNVMMATGGADSAPSQKNLHVKWIFSTSLAENELRRATPRVFPADGKFKLIVACRLEPKKGAETIVESLPNIVKKFPNATLDIVGGGSLLNDLKRRAQILNLENKITFHGKVAQPRVVELLKQAHVFCFPTSASEGFPKVVLEALASGLPVITTRVSVLPRLVNEDCGILLDAPTAENLATAIYRIFDLDAENYNRMSQIAINVANEFSLENWRDRIGETLRQSWNVTTLSST